MHVFAIYFEPNNANLCACVLEQFIKISSALSNKKQYIDMYMLIFMECIFRDLSLQWWPISITDGTRRQSDDFTINSKTPFEFTHAVRLTTLW